MTHHHRSRWPRRIVPACVAMLLAASPSSGPAVAARVAGAVAAMPSAATPGIAASSAAAIDTAGPATMLRAEALRRRPQDAAPVLATLRAGSAVQRLASRPGWWQVDSAAGRGWVRMFSVAATAGPAAAPAGGADRAWVPASRASSHALLLGVSRFASLQVPPLPGVGHDLASAAALAQAMGVPAAQTTVLRDDALTLEGMVNALQQLLRRVQPGDRVFVYFSGHGTRYVDAGRAGSPCVSSLLTHDGQPFTDSMLAEALTQLADRSDKLFVFVDACFSGGAAVPSRGTVLTPKFFARSGVASACGQPSNVVTRGLSASGPQRWAGRDNFIYLSAARETEVAFEEAGAGGFATRAVRDCTLREARDLDASGSVSVAEIAACAQQRIDRWLAGSRDYTPHHLTLLGNQHFVPMLGAATGARTEPAVGPSRPAAVSPPATPAPSPAPGVAAPGAHASAAAAGPGAATGAAPATSPEAPLPGALPPGELRPDRLLRDLHAQRDARRELAVQLARNELSIRRRERLALTLRSPSAGHVYLLHAGSDGGAVELLFPNAVDRDNRIAAGQTLVLPRAGWAMQARGPVGSDRLLLMVSDSPRDFTALAARGDGVFAALPVSPATVRPWLQAAAMAPAAGCGAAGAAGAPVAACGNGFASVLLELREVP